MLVTSGAARTRDNVREWRLVTKPYCQQRFPDLLTLGEVGLATGADGKIRRRVDGVVLRAPTRGTAA